MSTPTAYSVVSRINPVDHDDIILIFRGDAWIMSMDCEPGGVVHLWGKDTPAPPILRQIMRYCETMGLTVVVH